tara:strand:+ start:173 stop:1351 length:1179 start_codon:yes stop_codon:yes gene_type:complete
MIYLHEPLTNKIEKKYVLDCLKTNHLAFGKYIGLFENKIKNILKVKHAVACVNGTSALQISIQLLNLQPKEEILVPTITFISPVNAIKYNNLSPVFLDSDESLNVDEEKIIDYIKNYTYKKYNKKKKITVCINKKTNKRIGGMLIVHTFGNPARFEKLYKLCKKMNISIIEDSAESLGAYYKKGFFKNRYTGSIGDLGCISFNGNKIITSIGGGIITTNKKSYAKKARYLINQAKKNSLNFVHDDIGYNFRISNIHAAVGYAQSLKLKHFIKKKKIIHNYYKKVFSKSKNIKLISPPEDISSNYWLNLIYIDFKKIKISKKKFIEMINQKNIQIRPIWKPNHLQKPYINFQRHKIIKAPKIINNYICLPSGVNLKYNQVKLISKEIMKIIDK